MYWCRVRCVRPCLRPSLSLRLRLNEYRRYAHCALRRCGECNNLSRCHIRSVLLLRDCSRRGCTASLRRRVFLPVSVVTACGSAVALAFNCRLRVQLYAERRMGDVEYAAQHFEAVRRVVPKHLPAATVKVKPVCRSQAAVPEEAHNTLDGHRKVEGSGMRVALRLREHAVESHRIGSRLLRLWLL